MAALERLARGPGRPRRAAGEHGRQSRTVAGERQLEDGLGFLLTELAKLSAAQPEAAERLRIPGSVDATSGRLEDATQER